MTTINYTSGENDTSPIVLSDDSTQLQVTSGTATQSGVISQTGGAHALAKTGAGTLVLNQNETYTGVTTISAGVLQLGDGSASANGLLAGNVVDNGELDFDHYGQIFETFSGNISGSGSLDVIGYGEGLTLLGTSAYSGGTTVTAGYLLIGNGTTVGSITGNVALQNESQIIFRHSDNVTFAGIISGAGSLEQDGTGTLTLSGTNTYSQGTIVESGILAFSSDSNLGTGSVRLDAGSLQFDTSFTSALNYQINGIGQFDTNGYNVVLAGIVSTGLGASTKADGGITKIGAGTLTLTGANTYTGPTTISAGTLQLDNGETNGPVQGDITDNAALDFDTGGLFNYSGAITGTGSLTVSDGLVALLGNGNNFSGGTTVTSGGLWVGGAGGFGGSTNSGSLTGNVSLPNLEFGQGGTGLDYLGFGLSGTYTYSGNISGAGHVEVDGTGTVTFTGDNSGHAGYLELADGVLQVASDANLGGGIIEIAGGTLRFLASFASNLQYQVQGAVFDTNGQNVTLAGSLTAIEGGTNGINKVGLGTLTLTNTDTYVGATVISAGTLALSGSGSIANSSGVADGGIFDISQTSGASISGLSGTGTVALGSETLTIQGGGPTTFSGAIEDGGIAGGTGGSLYIASGSLTLNSNNTYTGTTTIGAAAILDISLGTLSTGPITDNGSLVFNSESGFDIVVANPISGNGNLSLGSTSSNAILWLTGVSDFTGSINVGRATLIVDGSIASSSVNISGLGTLEGTGTVGGNVEVTTYGHLSPGIGHGGVGVLNLSGSLTLDSGANLTEDFQSNAYDRTIIGGTASLSGTLTANFSSGSYTPGQTYTILSSTGALSGSFSSVVTTGLPSTLSASVTYDAHNAYLTIQNAFQPEVNYVSGVNADGTVSANAFDGLTGVNPATYSSTQTAAHKWGGDTAGTAGGTVYYYFDPASNWNSTEQQVLSAGLSLWSDIANITFLQTTNSAAAQVTFTRGSDGGAETTVTGATDNSPGGTAGQVGGNYLYTTTSATVSLDTSVGGFGPIDGNFANYGGYVFDTVVHEEGHVLGLGHAGPYNGTVNPATQQLGPYDTRQWSLMSYIDPNQTNAEYYSDYTVTGTNWGVSSGSDGNLYYNVPTTWMPLDILAAQSLYGVATNTPLSGGQTFGFNSNIAGPTGMFFDFTQNQTPVITIWDAGTGNTLDLSGFSAADTVNLNAGTFSSVDGLINNIAIAFGTAIDSLAGSAGNDAVTANTDGDTVFGNAGDDTLIVGSGSDIDNGGGGWNRAVYSGSAASYTITHNSNGTVTVTGLGDTDTLTDVDALVFSDKTVAVATMSSADFNGDGAGDLVWQDANGQAAVWLLNGSGTTSTAAVGADPGTSWRIAGTGDFDGDGRADILWQNDSGQAAIWLMNGTTVLSAVALPINPGTSWHIQGAGDFNGDGKSDILWQNDSGQADIWFMNGTTLTSSAAVGPNPGTSWHIKGAGDFNGDGDADILWQNDFGQADIWLMNGANVVSSVAVGANPGPSWHVIGTGDFNGDGDADILWQNDSGQAAIWLMNGTTVLSEVALATNPGPSWHVIGAADVNGDGDADILWQNSSGQADVWFMNGTTVLSTALVGGDPGAAWHIANNGTAIHVAHDFDGDGNADLLWQNDSGQADVWLMNGTTLSSSALVGANPGASWHVMGSGDFDGDGKADILWQNDSGQADIWFMNGTTVVSSGLAGNNTDPSWHIKASGDFDGDGKSDILWQNDSGQADIWFMNGTTLTSSAAVGDNPGTSWHIKGAGDFNGDGDADILWQNDSGQADIWLMNGANVVSSAAVGPNPGSSWHVIGTGDFNGDGDADILWQNDSGQAAIWLMNGTTVLSEVALATNPGPTWHVIGAADVNGDGKSDILWQNDSGQSAVWLMNGTTVLSAVALNPNPGTSWHVIAPGG